MRPFEGFKRRAVVVVVSDEEQAKRQALQEEQDGKDVPNSAVLEMKGIANYVNIILCTIMFYFNVLFLHQFF